MGGQERRLLRWAWGQDRAPGQSYLESRLFICLFVCTKLVQIYLSPTYHFFLYFFSFQEKQRKFEGDGEFNLVYENL